MWIDDPLIHSKWLLTSFYGESDTSKRSRTWSLLNKLKPKDQTPWLVIGDFNEVLFHHEKVGGKQRSEFLMSNFGSSLDYTELHDLGYKGDKFT